MKLIVTDEKADECCRGQQWPRGELPDCDRVEQLLRREPVTFVDEVGLQIVHQQIPAAEKRRADL